MIFNIISGMDLKNFVTSSNLYINFVDLVLASDQFKKNLYVELLSLVLKENEVNSHNIVDSFSFNFVECHAYILEKNVEERKQFFISTHIVNSYEENNFFLFFVK